MGWFISKVSGFWQWSRRFPKKVTIPVAILLLGVLTLAGVEGGKVYNYVETNPTFCRACHTMQKPWELWYASVHRSVDCHSCHSVGPIEGAQLLITFSLGRPEQVSKHASVQDGVCETCHESNNPRWKQVANTAGHKVHAEEQNISCVKCHAVSVHRFDPPAAICRVCHEEKEVKITTMAEQHCTTCHNYLTEFDISEGGVTTLLPRREDCLRCHAQLDVRLNGQKVTWPTDAPMQFTCSQCHKPHQQAAPVVDCLSCHKNLGGLHLDSAAQRVQCQTCHRPHQWRIPGAERTGPLATPSTPGATPSVATPTAATPTAVAPKGPPAIPHSLEGRSDCLVCHGADGIKPFPADHAGRTKETCTACHRAKQ